MSESSASSDASGVADENLVRRLAARRPGALSVRAGSHATAPRRCRRRRSRSGRAAGPGLVVAYLTRAVFPHQGARLPLRSEREMRTLAESLDLIVAGRGVAAADLLMQRFKAVEMAAMEHGGGRLLGT